MKEGKMDEIRDRWMNGWKQRKEVEKEGWKDGNRKEVEKDGRKDGQKE